MPDKIIPTKYTINKIGIINFKNFFWFLKYKGIKKKENKKYLCMYPPAINSSPKGPPSFLTPSMVSYPKITTPNINC